MHDQNASYGSRTARTKTSRSIATFDIQKMISVEEIYAKRIGKMIKTKRISTDAHVAENVSGLNTL